MKHSFAGDQVGDPGGVISPLLLEIHLPQIPQEQFTASLSKNENLMRFSV